MKRFFTTFIILLTTCAVVFPGACSLNAQTVGAVTPQHTLPRHHAYEWNGLSLDDLHGAIRVPVIFVGFSQSSIDNEKSVSSSNQNNWMTRLNTSNPANHMGDDGSVNDFFLAQSYGAMDVTFERIGIYTATGAASDYATSNAVLARQAILAQKDVDWSRFDANGDGEVECVLLVYAGHCDGDDNSSHTVVTSIYPHQSWMKHALGSRTKVADGVYVQSFVWMNNLRNGSATGVDATNTACHELSHGIFDLPDYYRNGYSFLGQYDPMCYGFRQLSYGSSSNHCCGYSAFNRMYLGWLTPYELTEPCHVVLRPLSLYPDACIIFDPADDNHFFLLENRQAIATTWDAHLPASGLVVTEVHFNQQHFDYHNINGGSVPDVQIIRASDGEGIAYPNDTYLSADQSLIPFGIDGRDAIPSTVDPVMSRRPVTNIAVDADGNVSFDFMGGGETLDPVASISVRSERLSAVIYNLHGQHTAVPQGLSIIDGRKTLR